MKKIFTIVVAILVSANLAACSSFKASSSVVSSSNLSEVEASKTEEVKIYKTTSEDAGYFIEIQDPKTFFATDDDNLTSSCRAIKNQLSINLKNQKSEDEGYYNYYAILMDFTNAQKSAIVHAKESSKGQYEVREFNTGLEGVTAYRAYYDKSDENNPYIREDIFVEKDGAVIRIDTEYFEENQEKNDEYIKAIIANLALEKNPEK